MATHKIEIESNSDWLEVTLKNGNVRYSLTNSSTLLRSKNVSNWN